MITLMLKATLVLLAGGLGAIALRHRSAAFRHLIWTVTLAGAIGVALTAPVLPSLPVPVGGWTRALSIAPASGVFAPSGQKPVVGDAAGPEAAAVAPAPATIHRSAAEQVTIIWLAGSLAVLGWCLLGRLGLSGLLRRAAPFRDPAWLEDLEAGAAAARVTSPVGLFISPRIGSPATWGLLRTVIVLPPAARGWTAERRRVVLAHELAHVARHDGLANLIGWIACALYWPNPLAWMAARRLRAEAERAADDHVLLHGVPAAEYAAHLLDVARGSRVMRLLGASAIGMARPSSLEGRLLDVLDETRNRLAPRALTRRATWMTCAGFVLPLAAVTPSTATVAARLSALAAERPFAVSDSTFEKSYPARAGERLTLDLKTGASVHVSGWDEPTVRIRGTLSGLSWRGTVVEVERQSAGIRVVTTQERQRDGNSSTSHRFEIQVPRRYDVQIESAGGEITISGVEGSFTGHTGGGELHLDHARGRASLTTGGGDIRVSDSELDGRVSTGGGMVQLSRVSGDLRGSSGSGPVIHVGDDAREKGDLRGIDAENRDRIRVSEELSRASGTLHIEKAGGDIDLERAPNGANVRTGGGHVRIGRSAGLVRARTGGGDITIGPVEGSIEASTGAGNFQGTLENEDGSVEFTTGKGSAVVTLPRGFNGRFDLETAYTRSHPRTTIETDWELSESETEEWDSSQGTPRKYVRATGRAGSGPGIIRIQIVNGDITIRRAR